MVLKVLTVGMADKVWVYRSERLGAHIIEIGEDFTRLTLYDEAREISQSVLFDGSVEEERELIDNILATFRYKIETDELPRINHIVADLDYAEFKIPPPISTDDWPEELQGVSIEDPWELFRTSDK